MLLVVSRFEDQFVICEGDEHKMFAIPKEESPQGLSVGDVLRINSEGELSVDAEETQKRRSNPAKKPKSGKK